MDARLVLCIALYLLKTRADETTQQVVSNSESVTQEIQTNSVVTEPSKVDVEKTAESVDYTTMETSTEIVESQTTTDSKLDESKVTMSPVLGSSGEEEEKINDVTDSLLQTSEITQTEDSKNSEITESMVTQDSESSKKDVTVVAHTTESTKSDSTEPTKTDKSESADSDSSVPQTSESSVTENLESVTTEDKTSSTSQNPESSITENVESTTLQGKETSESLKPQNSDETESSTPQNAKDPESFIPQDSKTSEPSMTQNSDHTESSMPQDSETTSITPLQTTILEISQTTTTTKPDSKEPELSGSEEKLTPVKPPELPEDENLQKRSPSSEKGEETTENNLDSFENNTNCSEVCSPNKNENPVCGSDGIVYESECHLKMKNCGKNVKITSWENCRGKHPLCPDECLNIQDPVCGDDGKIYPNLCLLYKFNCGKRMKTHHLVRCFTNFRSFRRVDNACPKVCPELYRPVCGSDGKIYSNECFLRIENCGKNDVQIVDMSECVTTPKCPHSCTPLPDPVCGSDGLLYLNHCYFANLNCGKKTEKMPRSFCEQQQQLK